MIFSQQVWMAFPSSFCFTWSTPQITITSKTTDQHGSSIPTHLGIAWSIHNQIQGMDIVQNIVQDH